VGEERMELELAGGSCPDRFTTLTASIAGDFRPILLVLIDRLMHPARIQLRITRHFYPTVTRRPITYYSPFLHY
jgi:hypothetical protein